MTRHEALQVAVHHLHEHLPYLPAHTVNDLVERPRTVAPDEVTYARVTGLPPQLVHTLWKDAA